MKLLISVRSVEEAQLVARGGADFIDLKEPGQGALGALPIETVSSIVRALRVARIELPVSATIGDVSVQATAELRTRVHAVAACRVTYVKVGIENDPAAWELLDWLAGCGANVVPVFIADRGVNRSLVEYAAGLRFPGLMLDTADKGAGSLLDLLPGAQLRAFLDAARGGGALAGLAGALRAQDAPALAELAPDFAGFRSAVCVGQRSAALDAELLAALVQTMREAQLARCMPTPGRGVPRPPQGRRRGPPVAPGASN